MKNCLIVDIVKFDKLHNYGQLYSFKECIIVDIVQFEKVYNCDKILQFDKVYNCVELYSLKLCNCGHCTV